MDFNEEYFNIWRQAWQFHKRSFDNDRSDYVWEQIADESAQLVKKYKDDFRYGFMKDLILSILNELERVDKQRQMQEAKTNEKEEIRC